MGWVRVINSGALTGAEVLCTYGDKASRTCFCGTAHIGKGLALSLSVCSASSSDRRYAVNLATLSLPAIHRTVYITNGEIGLGQVC